MAFPLHSCTPLYTERAPQTQNHLERGEGRRGRSGLGVSKADGGPQAQAREPREGRGKGGGKKGNSGSTELLLLG